MVAFNFQERFVPLIESGKKISTVRSSQRCCPGHTMHLYAGLRTKKCRQIKKVVCAAVYEFSIDEYRRVLCKHPDAGYLYRQEGFDTPDDMIDFFEEHYGLPFYGFLHEWGAK